AGHDRALTPGPSPAAAGEGSGLVRGRIMALASINPALAGWERTLARALDGGARGFGELRPHNQGWEPLGAEAMRFYAAADGAGAVLLWHVTEPVGHVYPGKGGGISPAELARVAEAFPALRMVAAHMGGGLAFFLQMPELRVALANVYFDTAAYPLLYDDASVARLVDLAGPERVIFGSDYPLLSPRRQLERIKPLLPPDAVRAVCGDTAGSLFRDIREQ
ncbi:MAG: amidohydrolase family protein, partial [Dehalococcoidia bacterium]